MAGHHEATLARLSREFDVDTSAAQRQLSLGMRIASFLGALALCAAVVLFVRRFWGGFPIAVQVVLLAATPVGAVLAAGHAAERERTRYFTSLLCLVAFAAFVLDLHLLGGIFNSAPSLARWAAWAAFALALAYAFDLRVVLVAGIACAAVFVAGLVQALAGGWPLAMWDRPENFLVAGLAAFAVPLAVDHARNPDLPEMYRLFGGVATLLAVFALSTSGEPSYLPLRPGAVEAIYQVLGFGLSGGAIVLGIRRRWPEIANLGSVSFVVFLFARFFDWWWDWMPRYLFFLILGLVAVGLIVALGRLRRARQ